MQTSDNKVLGNTVLGEEAEITGKVAFICALFYAYENIQVKPEKYKQINKCIKKSNLFSKKEFEEWKKGGLGGLCQYYGVDDEFEGTLMSFVIPESGHLLKGEES
jgi:hypothetical protein